MSKIAPQSETTCPLKFHDSLNIFSMSSLLPQQGLLFVLLYAHIIASTFTSTKDLNAGKYVSYKSFFDTCALKLCLSFSGPE